MILKKKKKLAFWTSTETNDHGTGRTVEAYNKAGMNCGAQGGALAMNHCHRLPSSSSLEKIVSLTHCLPLDKTCMSSEWVRAIMLQRMGFDRGHTCSLVQTHSFTFLASARLKIDRVVRSGYEK
jgi:hypothetical protein